MYHIFPIICISLFDKRGMAACGFGVADKTMTHSLCRVKDPGVTMSDTSSFERMDGVRDSSHASLYSILRDGHPWTVRKLCK